MKNSPAYPEKKDRENKLGHYLDLLGYYSTMWKENEYYVRKWC